MKAILAACFVVMAGVVHAGPVSSFDDIEFWVGSGSNEAAMVVDWVEESNVDESLTWGYRWDGTASGEDMFRAVLAADSRLFAKVQDYGGSLGIALYGMGYDDGDGVFDLTDGTVFDSDGLAAVSGPADGATAVDSDDFYGEGWFTAFWHYGVSTGNPFGGGSWSSSGLGMTSRMLTDGDWDSWAHTPTFNFSSFAENPVAASVPEPATVLLLAAVVPFFLRRRLAAPACALLVAATLGIATADASPFAVEVVSYTPGDPIGVGNPAPYQTDGSQALGEPSRDTAFGSQVGVFYPAYYTDELAIVGAGGELTVRFDQPVENDPANPFGIDLLVFGNAFYVISNNVATSAFIEPGNISVSKDNVTWYDVPGVFADDLFPTLGYTDTVYSGFGNSGGTVPTDFTKPVDPSFDAIGLTESEINAAYNGSGGGTGVDLDLVGLDWIQYVRVWQPGDATWSTEIDGFADVAAAVPEPSSVLLIAASALVIAFRRRAV